MDIVLTGVLALLGTIFIFNVNPFFTLPTWILISLFIGNPDVVAILPIILAAVGISAVARYMLACYSGPLFHRYIPKRQVQNIKFLDDFLRRNTGIAWPFTVSFFYAFSPLPTNALFIVAGAGKFRLPVIFCGFFLGELLSNIAYLAILKTTLSMGDGLIFGAIGLVIALAILFIDWKKVIESLMEREMKRHASKN